MACSSSLSVASSACVGRHEGSLLQDRDCSSLASVSFRALRLSSPSPSPLCARRVGGLPLFRTSSAAVVAPVEEQAAVAPPRLRLLYVEKVVPALKEEFKYSNSLEVPRVVKVVVNCGVGEAAQNAKTLESTIKDVSLVTGQKPVITRAKKAIAGFKIRKDVPVGTCVTLRGEVMFSFLDRLINLALPRTRDFQGVNPYSFDGKGNYNLGMKEQSVFPEIKFDTIDQPRGMDISIFTTAKSDKEGQKLLTLLGMPFRDSKTVVRAPVVRKKKGFKYSSKGSKKK